ncbi:hypothetical protein [Candidatus Nitrososphaera evergladensis]|uniref:hypothetical protein n=1 Tax=Candidatus Nitrososphaera evergladensis TaxID=1459637 RepID=UPI0011E5D1C1|nr:hypothetical protein [Candidatus Nitrososphaera evergladensis]
MSRPKTAKWLKFEPATGKPVASKFAGGSYDALQHRPVSIKRPDSNYRRILAVLAEIRASGRAWLSGAEITTLYNQKYGTTKKTADIEKPLSRFYVWQWVDYRETKSRYALGLWSLKPDVNVQDIDDLFARAESHEQIFNGKKGYEK